MTALGLRVAFGVLACALLGMSPAAEAQWAIIKKSLPPEVRILEETNTRLVLGREDDSTATVVMTIKPAGDADLHGGSEARRGGNVYRVWITTENFWQKPYLAEDGGKKFFGERLAKAFRREELISPPPPGPVPEEQEQLIAADTLEPPPVATAEPVEPPVEEIIADSAIVDTPEVVDANVVEETPAPPEEPQQAEEVRAETSAFEPATSSSHEPNPETETEWTWTEPADSPIAEEELAESQNSFEPAPPEKEEAQPMATVKAPSRLFEGSGALAAISAIAALILLPVLSVVFSPTFRARYCMFRGEPARAAVLYETILARRPGKTKLYVELANAYLLLGRQDDQAMRIFKIVLQLQPAVKNSEAIKAIITQKFLHKGKMDDEKTEHPKSNS